MIHDLTTLMNEWPNATIFVLTALTTAIGAGVGISFAMWTERRSRR